jgi:hypothetical protein
MTCPSQVEDCILLVSADTLLIVITDSLLLFKQTVVMVYIFVFKNTHMLCLGSVTIPVVIVIYN